MLILLLLRGLFPFGTPDKAAGSSSYELRGQGPKTEHWLELLPVHSGRPFEWPSRGRPRGDKGSLEPRHGPLRQDELGMPGQGLI